MLFAQVQLVLLGEVPSSVARTFLFFFVRVFFPKKGEVERIDKKKNIAGKMKSVFFFSLKGFLEEV